MGESTPVVQVRGFGRFALLRVVVHSLCALSAPHQLKNEACSTLAAPSCGLFREKMLLPTAFAETSFIAWQGEGCFFWCKSIDDHLTDWRALAIKQTAANA